MNPRMPNGQQKCRCTAAKDHSPGSRSIFTDLAMKGGSAARATLQCTKKHDGTTVFHARVPAIREPASCAATTICRDYSHIDKDHSTETRMIFGERVFTLRS